MLGYTTMDPGLRGDDDFKGISTNTVVPAQAGTHRRQTCHFDAGMTV